ncbi:PAS domain S-box protein [Verrucomicrobiota bacterium sgz303538]
MVDPDLTSHHTEQSEQKFRLLVESVKDYAIFMLDVDGNVATWNAGAEKINGYSANEIIGSHFSRFYPTEDIIAGKPEWELKEAVANGHVEDEGWRLRKDGSRFWADVVITSLWNEAGELQGFAKVTRDLTERKLAEEKQRASEEQFRLLVASVQEYAIFMLDTTGHVATWNAGAQRIKGYTFEEIVNQSFERFYLPEDRIKGKPARLLEIARREGSAHDLGPRMRKDGSVFQAEVVITAIRDEGGALLGFSKVTHDITEQIRIREIETARIAAEKANAAKDEFLAVLSHELRTPMTPVLAAASYLVENASKLPPELREEVRTIRRNVQLEAQLIDDLLDLTRISRGKIELSPEVVDLHTVLFDVIEICKEDITAKGLEISTAIHAQEHWVWADPVRIRQVFWNIVNNAVKFTPPNGRITIRSANDERENIRVDIVDTGIGIVPENLVRIFSAFEQGERGVTRRFGGLGLGLAITKSLVEVHRGSISVSSEGKGRGTCFAITLPHSVHQKTSKASQEPVKVIKSLRILLVDDHEDTRRILSKLLEQREHRVSTAGSVQSALECLETNRFDVLISDIGLPDGSGHELMRAVKERQSLKGIALSGFGMPEDLHRSHEAGFDHHMIKPVDFQNLQSVLSRLFS